MTQDLSKIHYKKCRYPECNLTSRDGVPGLTFHAFPVRQADRCIKWLVNCGLDDWVDMSEKDLKLRYVCSRHFAEDNFYATGRLKREAVPIILGLENENSKTKKNACKVRKVVSTETDFLKKQIEKLELKLTKEREKKLEIRAKLCATRVALSRLKAKLTEGTFSDMYLNKALANKLQGFVLTFIRMQLFHKPSTCYTTDEQRLCMMMHCISPALYSKMRDDFKFVLPNEMTMVRWFNKLNIIPKKAKSIESIDFDNILNESSEENENCANEEQVEMENENCANEEQVEILEKQSEKLFKNEHFDNLEDELELEMNYSELNEAVVLADGEVQEVECVPIDNYGAEFKESRVIVSYLKEKENNENLPKIFELECNENGEGYKLIKELVNVNVDFDSSQLSEVSMEYAA